MIVPIIIMEIDIYMKNKCTFRKAKYKKYIQYVTDTRKIHLLKHITLAISYH